MAAAPVTKPQREVILRQGPLAGIVWLVPIDVISVCLPLEDTGEDVTYKQDPNYPDYFVYDPEAGPDDC